MAGTSRMDRLYFDHQASTPVTAAVAQAMYPYFSDVCANPHSNDHAAGWVASGAIEEARARVAEAIGCDSDEIVFTSGATEANNLAILGAAEAAPRDRMKIVVTSIEHKSVLAPARALSVRGFEVITVPVSHDGTLDFEAFAEALARKPFLVSVGAVNSEIGTVQDLERIGEMLKESDALLHSDATQALAWRAIDVESAKLDLASFSAHKMGGPKGIGALFVRRECRDQLRPIQFGGEQQGGLRPGTLPTPLCVGFGVACETLPHEQEIVQWRRTTSDLMDKLSLHFPSLRVNGTPCLGHPGNLSVTIPGIEADALLARLQPGLAISRGSACTSGLPEPSHVLRAIGFNSSYAASTLRFSTSPSTTKKEVELAISMLRDAMRNI